MYGVIEQIRIQTRRAKGLVVAHSAISRFPQHEQAPRHTLPGELIVSLTSYPARYPVLPYTLKALLDQTVKPDRTILWIAQNDFAVLTPAILELQEHGLEILQCDDLRSYKKIVPMLEMAPGSFIVTADDDLHYEPDWLRQLIEAYDPAEPAIVCRRAHQPGRDQNGRLRPYADWQLEVMMAPDEAPRDDLFPTGVGGVLYFPGALAGEVTDRAAFTELCPSADDIWLYWMGRMAGTHYRQTGGDFRQASWLFAQRTSLRTVNVDGGGNDQQVRAMEERFGLY
jgi:hypothetical protein